MSRDMTNVEQELVAAIAGRTVDYGRIRMSCDYRETFPLDQRWRNHQEYLAGAAERATHEYYAGYGTQYLYGVVVLDGGIWLTRFEYDGSEGWEEHKIPTYMEVMDDSHHNPFV